MFEIRVRLEDGMEHIFEHSDFTWQEDESFLKFETQEEGLIALFPLCRLMSVRVEDVEDEKVEEVWCVR